MEQEQEPELPDDVVAAIRAGDRVKAVNLLSEQHGIGVAEAKRQVDLYAAKNPRLLAGSEMSDQGTGLRVLVAVAVVIGLYVAWRYLA